MCKAFGCQFKHANATVKHIIEKIEPGTTARMVMQAVITPERENKQGPKSNKVLEPPPGADLTGPVADPWDLRREKSGRKVEPLELLAEPAELLKAKADWHHTPSEPDVLFKDRAPERPNVYSDGSLKQNKCYSW